MQSQITLFISTTACSYMCPVPPRAEEKWREVKQRERNSSSSHCQHNCPGGGILLVKHWTGLLTRTCMCCFFLVWSDWGVLSNRLWKLNFSLKFTRRDSKLWAYKKHRPKVSSTLKKSFGSGSMLNCAVVTNLMTFWFEFRFWTVE